jgi:hypothetical protein
VARLLLPAAAALLLALPAPAQQVDWKSEVVFYGDNTEFFTPYRQGETLLGAYFKTFLSVRPGEHSELLAGVFGDHRDGGESFLDPVRPILAFRYRTATSLGVIGTLETVDRHGYLEPLEGTTLEITRPVEYGLQWIETRSTSKVEAFIDWQKLNTVEHREVFDYGLLLHGDLLPWLRLEGQLHGLHHGGQLYDVGGVTNNVVWAAGGRLRGRLPGAIGGELAAFYLSSAATLDPNVDGRQIDGHGTYVRGELDFGKAGKAFAIAWKGTDFITHEGDHNYGSVGWQPGFYKPDRDYQELGYVFARRLEAGIDLDLEARLHRIDGEVEYSYRVMVKVPVAIPVSSR